jgi:Domain of unknown function (DUF4440)
MARRPPTAPPNPVTEGGRGAVAAELREAHEALCDALVLGDAPELDALLADGFTITHLTGTEQSKAEWLADLDADRIGYRAIDVVEVAVAATGPAPVLTARSITEATLPGGSGTWHLQLRIVFRREQGRWRASDAVATTW